MPEPTPDSLPVTPSPPPVDSTPTRPEAALVPTPGNIRGELPGTELHRGGIAGASRTQPSLPGYDVLYLLGRGGMGIVYKARQLALDRLVALKMVLTGGQASPEELLRFKTEVTAVARLQHTNIVQIYEVGEADGLPFCALE